MTAILDPTRHVIAPPFTLETAILKVREAEDAWNSQTRIKWHLPTPKLGVAEPDRVPGRARADPPIPERQVACELTTGW